MFLYLIFLLEIAKKLIVTLREKCPHSEFFWSVFSRIWTECPNARKCGPEKLPIRTLFTKGEQRYETLVFRTTIFHKIC